MNHELFTIRLDLVRFKNTKVSNGVIEVLSKGTEVP